MSANLENSTVATGAKRVSFIPISKKDNAKECSYYCATALIKMLVRLCYKSFKLSFSTASAENFQRVKHRLSRPRGRGTRDPITNIHWIMEKAREF